MDPSSQCHHPQSQWSSDSEIYSISSPETVSPAPSMDFNSSPPHHQPKNTRPNKPARSKETKKAASRRSRLRNPSEQRQNASEKEKLRMRDLTKALHHLRTYLPPSVAPAGQTLTKIETLRLTIRYISYLSSQLGLTEEYLSQRKQMDSSSSSSSSGWRSSSSPELLGHFHCRSTQGQEYNGDYTGQHQHQTGSNLVYTDQSMDMNQDGGQLSEPWTNQIYSSDRTMETFQPQQCAQLTQSCQVYSYHLVPPAYWS